LGPLLSDSNTGGFTRDIKDENLVFLGHEFCQVKGKKFENTHFLPVLRRLVEELRKDPKAYGLPRTQAQQKIEV
jgi:pyruvate decarboxylase